MFQTPAPPPQVRQWLQDRRSAVNEALDAWSRFLQLHAAVMAWSAEKGEFVARPLSFASLGAARLKLQDYAGVVKSAKGVGKSVADMGRELAKIGQVGKSRCFACPKHAVAQQFGCSRSI